MNHDQLHTPHDPIECADIQAQLDAWALSALEPDERAAVDAHLATCPRCRKESRAWSDVASMLPLSLTPVRPSLSAKQALMRRIADDQMASIPAGEPEHAPQSAPSIPMPEERSRHYHWAQVLIAPLAIALVIMTLWSFQLKDELDASPDEGTIALSSMLPDGFQAFQMKPECEACETTGRLLADPQKAEALMVAWNLDPGEVHEVWCEEGDGSRALVANLQADDSGEVVQSLAFDQPISGYSRIYVISQDGERVEIRMSDLLDSTPPSVTGLPSTTGNPRI